MTFAAVAAIAAAAAVAVVALAFALYAVMVPYAGQAGAAATVAVVAALLVLIAGLIAAAKAKNHTRQAPQGHDLGLVEVILGLVKDRPLVSAGVGLAAAVFMLRNPAFIGSLLRAFMEGRAPPHKD